MTSATLVWLIWGTFIGGLLPVQCIENSQTDTARKISMSHAQMHINEILPNHQQQSFTMNASNLNEDQHQQHLPPISSGTAKPVYTAEQYIDYYWQSPPVHRINKVESKESASEMVEKPATVNMSMIVKRTVSVVIEQIRSMWEFVWSYFSEPAPPMLNTMRSLARTMGNEEDDDDDDDEDDDEDETEDDNAVDNAPELNADVTTGQTRHRDHVHGVRRRRRRNRFRKFLVPLLMAYKLKFFTMIPMIISGLVLLTGSAGMTGFFFALFTAVLSMKHKAV